MSTEQKNGSRTLIEVVAIWSSLVVSLTSLGFIVWKGGALSQLVVATALRVDKLESAGSAGLSTHVVMDDVRVNALDKRLIAVEQAIIGIGAIREDIREIRTRLQMMTIPQSQQNGDQKQPGISRNY